MVFFLISVMALGMLGYQFNWAMSLMDMQTQNYYNINAFSEAFLTADRELEAIVRSSINGEIYIQPFKEAQREADYYLEKVSEKLTTDETEQYLLITAVNSGYSYYMENAAVILEERQRDENGHVKRNARYYSENAVTAEYIHQYVSQLLATEISEGRRIHLRSKDAINYMFYGWIAMFFVLNLLAIFELFRLCDKAFLHPIREISDALRHIEGGDFDIPDIQTNREDETAQLVAVFNTMKHSTKQLVMTLREKNELEHALHLRMEEAAQRKQQLEIARYAHLKSQVNPHFLFNTLNIISRVARVENAGKTEGLIVSLARTFRYSMNTDAAHTTLAREIECIDDYMMIQQIRFEDRVHFSWRIDSCIDPKKVVVVPYTLQPFVENAILHGLRDTLRDGRIRVTIRRRGICLLILVTDNGSGMSSAQLEAVRRFDAPKGGEHIGIYNVRYRLKLLEAESSLKIYSYPGYGTCVKILIPQGGFLNEDIGCG